MNSLIKNCAFATMLSLAMATNANAVQLDNNAPTNIKLANSPSLIAQKKPGNILKETRSRRFVDEMIMLHMKMVEMSEEAMQSPDPEIKKMAQETIKSSNAEINKMMEMRRKMYTDILSDG